MNYCHSFVQDNSFADMLNRVDIDEKWFYLSQKVTSFILVPGEVPPLRLCKHKNHIEKAMCLTAMARPRQDPAQESSGTGRSVLGSSSDRNQQNERRRIERQGLWRLSLFPLGGRRKEIEDMILDTSFLQS